jgi:hypothetical protein
MLTQTQPEALPAVPSLDSLSCPPEDLSSLFEDAACAWWPALIVIVSAALLSMV